MAEDTGRCTWFEENPSLHDKDCLYSDDYYVGNNRCLFHQPKDSFSEEERKLFTFKLVEILRKKKFIWHYRGKIYVDMYGFVFPVNFDMVRFDIIRKSQKITRKFPLCLVDAQLHDAILEQILLQKANLSRVNLQGADLRVVQLQGANLESAQLQRANLRNAQLQGTHLSRVQLQGAKLNGAQLQGAKLNLAQLQHSSLQLADIRGAELIGVHLQGANLIEAQLQGAVLRRSRLQGANLDHASLNADPTFRPNPAWKEWVGEALFERMEGGLRTARLIKTSFGADDKHSPATLINADLRGVDLSSSNIAGANFTDARLDGTIFRGVKFGKKDKKGEWNNKWYRRNRWERSKPPGWLRNWLTKLPLIGRLFVLPELPIFDGANIEAADWADNREAQRKFIYAEYIRQFKKNHPIIAKIWWLFADYGRSLKRWVLWSFGFATAFGAVFLGLGTEHFIIAHLSETDWVWAFYYSIVTFTTLGFGDVVPRTSTAAWIVAAEVALGYVMLGGLISIFAVKIARRN